QDAQLLQIVADRIGLGIEYERLYREAEETSRLKDEFLATVSHELRTPLTPILAWVSQLRRRQLDPARTARALEAIERSARVQARLIDDLLEVSRIIGGKLRLDLRPMRLASVTEAASEAMRPAAAAKNIRVVTSLDPRIELIWGDPERLQQVMWNLLSNAIKFTPEGGRVDVGLERGVDSRARARCGSGNTRGRGARPARRPPRPGGRRRAGHVPRARSGPEGGRCRGPGMPVGRRGARRARDLVAGRPPVRHRHARRE